MANSFTVTHRSDWGNFSVLLGTLAEDDGSAGLDAPTGMKHVYVAIANSNTNAQRCSSTSGGGGIIFVSAASGVSANVIVIGV